MNALPLLLATLAVGCTVGDAGDGVVANPGTAANAVDTDGTPARLADTGLYADFDARRIAQDVLPFSPQYSLWSDGASKRRWIRLPAGSSIDASDPDHWQFPTGTRLWKEFAFEQRIETRMLSRAADGSWTYAAYVWTPGEADAVLAPERGVRRACESRPGVPYDVPAALDCRLCHGDRPTPVLGFSMLQLSSDRDPLAPHAEPLPEGALDLAGLVERGLLRGLPERLLEPPPRIPARSERERAALGYLHGNCSACHFAGGPLASLDLDLEVRFGADDPGGPGPLASLLERPSHFRPAGGASDLRVAPGQPERSVLTQRMASRNPVSQMPPLGSHLADAEALDLLQAWIREDLAPAGPVQTLAKETHP